MKKTTNGDRELNCKGKKRGKQKKIQVESSKKSR